MKIICADQETTWPRRLRALLRERLAVLRAYEQHDRRVIERRVAGDIMMSVNPPPNPHAAARQDTLAEIDVLLHGVNIVGYHCTRLHEDEIAMLRQQGMRPLDRELVRGRIETRAQAGDLSSGAAARLLATTDTLERAGERRIGMTWFVFTKRSLRDEGGLSLLFSLWGGEALYVRHIDEPELAGILRQLGTACIVEAAVPVSAIETYCSVGERLARSFLHRRGGKTGHEPDWEGYVREPIEAGRIRRVLRRDDADFVRLTACTRWMVPLT